ncbi:hypothetical protein LINGRAHAP2_LOCUS35734, partial [Linum grandiflorum]
MMGKRGNPPTTRNMSSSFLWSFFNQPYCPMITMDQVDCIEFEIITAKNLIHLLTVDNYNQCR